MKKLFYITIPLIILASVFALRPDSLKFFASVFGVRPPIVENSAEAAATRTGLVGWWSMDANDMSATGATLYDKSGQNNFTSIGGSATSTQGKINQAVDFDGANFKLINTTATGLDFASITQSFTISVWVKADSIDATYDGIISTKAGGDDSWAIFRQTGESAFTFQYSANNYVVFANATIGKWQHYVAVYNGANNIQLYLNGVAGNSGVRTGTMTDNNRICLGIYRCNDSSHYFDGSIDDVRIYNRALSADEISTLYNSAKVGYQTAPSRSPGVSTGGKLVGYWTMDSGDMSTTGATLYDKSGQNNHGTVYGTTTSTGKINQARSFNGTSDYIKINNIHPSTLNFYYSLCAWAKLNSTTGQQLIVAPGNYYEESIGYNYSGNKFFTRHSWGGDPNNSIISGTTIPKSGQWYHVCGTLEALDGSNSTQRLYVNGVQENSATVTKTFWNYGGGTYIGNQWGGSLINYFNGSIDDVRIYNYALSAQEISNLYNSAKASYSSGPSRTGLVGYWTMDTQDMSATGATLYDRSGQNNNGTVTGTTTSTGKIGQARSFNGGATDLINIGDITTYRFTEVTPFTASLWYKGSCAGFCEMIEKRMVNDFYRFVTQSDGSLYLEIGDGSNALVLDPPTNLGTNSWHHIVVTYNGANSMAAYSDSVLIGTDTSPTLSGLNTTGGSLTIGNGVNGTFAGSIDDVRIYNYALSAQQVANLYNSSRKVYLR